MRKLKVLRSTDSVSMVFGEWFDKMYGNTYYDCFIRINGLCFEVEYCYGCNAPDKQAIDEALTEIGYRVRKHKRDQWIPYRRIHTVCKDKLKRELFKKSWSSHG